MIPEDTGHPPVVDVAHQKYGFGLSWLVLMLALPPLVYYLWICVTYYQGALALPQSIAEWRELWSHIASPTWAASLIYGIWFLSQAALQAWVPGRTVRGMPLPDGQRLEYRLNGMLSFLLTLSVLIVTVAWGWLDTTLLYDQIGPLLTVINIFTFAFSGFLYFWGLRGAAGNDRPVAPSMTISWAQPLTLGSDPSTLSCSARPVQE